VRGKLPRITAAEAIRVLEKAGFFLARQRVTVPYHSGKILHPKVLSSILRDADLTVEEFKELMR
jgi:predicted RNA binding protein YcfA (HicA-like mRNA interferase family)